MPAHVNRGQCSFVIPLCAWHTRLLLEYYRTKPAAYHASPAPPKCCKQPTPHYNHDRRNAPKINHLHWFCPPFLVPQFRRLSSLTHIGGLDNSITKPLLHAAFLPFGEIVEVNLPGSENERGHRGFGYVEFETAEDAAAAIDNMDQATLAGRTLSVAIAKPQTKEAGNVLSSKVAVWEQVCCSRGGEEEEVWAGLMRCAGNRKSGSGSTRSPMRTVRQQTQRRRRLWLKLSIRCKAWKDSMLLGQSRRASERAG